MDAARRWVVSRLPLGLALALVLPLGLAGGVSAGPLEAWLTVEDPPERCPAVVVLNGDHPGRADEAARLYRAAGGEIWLTSDPRSAGGGTDAGTRSNAARLAARGVPETAIHLVPGAATGTRVELELVAQHLRRRALPCAVLITSPLHGRRVQLTWRRAVGPAPRAVVRHAEGGNYTGWRVVVKEVALSLLAALGLPR